MTDDLARRILQVLRQDSRISADSVAVMLGAEPAAVAAKIADMEQAGIIVKYNTVINEDKLDNSAVQALIEVHVSPQRDMGFDAIAERLYRMEEVKSVYLMSGAFDLMVIVEGPTLKEVAMFVAEKLSMMDNVLSCATHFILKKYKDNDVILDGADTEQRLAVSP